MGIRDELKDFPDISFTDDISITEIREYYMKAMQDKYRELTGKELFLHEADPVRLIAYANCLLLYQMIQYAERAGKMSMLKYSYGDYLEHIGALKGIRRLEGAAAKTTIRFTLSMERYNVVIIPPGTRVTSGDGVYFYTLDLLEIMPGQLQGEVNAACKESGQRGNGYKPGELRVLVDPIPYMKSVENISESMGGADRESDDNLAERIYLAPSSWSTAGPDDAYKYWVMTYDPGIADVRVESEKPGIVNIYFILQDGVLPDQTMIGELTKYLMEEEIRPLTDLVIVRAPKTVNYTIDITYYINESDRTRAAAIEQQVYEAVKDYVVWQQEKIGRDINPDKLRSMVISAGAKRVMIRSPVFLKIPSSSVALLEKETAVIYGGLEDD